MHPPTPKPEMTRPAYRGPRLWLGLKVIPAPTRKVVMKIQMLALLPRKYDVVYANILPKKAPAWNRETMLAEMKLDFESLNWSRP